MAETDVTGKKEAMEIAEEAREKESKGSSFASSLFMGKPNFKEIFPFPKQPDEDRKIGDDFLRKVQDYLSKNLDPEIVDATGEIPKKVLKDLAEMKIFAMKVPKEYGGLGFSQTNYNRAVMKVASYCGSTGVLVSAHQSIGVPQPLIMFGTEKQKRKYFPWFVEGRISAFALTEPEVGSDPAKMSTEAILSDDGKDYILNGVKLWCTNGTIADVIVAVAKTKPKMVDGKEKKQISAFILEMDTPGVKVIHRCHFMGLNAIYNAMLKFTNVRIPKENLLGEEGRGLALALSTINVGRLTLPAACTGVAKQMLSIARRWGGARVQWGLPVGLHEAGREKIAYIAATTFAMEAMTYLTSALSDLGKDVRIEAAMAKYFCTEALWKITDLTLQLRGGRGFEKASSLIARGEVGFPVERALRDARVNTILEGSSEIMKLFLAREAIDPHLQKLKPLLEKKQTQTKWLFDLIKTSGFYSFWYLGQLLSSALAKRWSELKALEKHVRFSEKTSHRLARQIFYAMMKYQKRLEEKQMLLGRLTDIGTDLFAIAATCSYAHSLGDEATTIADTFCCMAKKRIALNFERLTNNDDRLTNQLASTVIKRDFLWLEEGIISVGPKEL